jgi:hypothetical protein
LRQRGLPRVIKKNHLKFSVTDGEATLEVIWWDRADAELPATMDVAFLPERQVFRGAAAVQLNARDVRPHGG